MARIAIYFSVAIMISCFNFTNNALAQYNCWAAEDCGVNDCEFGCGALYNETTKECVVAECTDSNGNIPDPDHFVKSSGKGNNMKICIKNADASLTRNAKGSQECK